MLVLFVLLSLSILSYQPEDIPLLKEPPNNPPYNWIGPAGAWSSYLLLEGFGLEERFTENEVRNAWREIVGEFIAQHTRPHSLLSGVLEVRVLQPSILYTLEREMKPQILSKLQSAFSRKAIREVKFRIG